MSYVISIVLCASLPTDVSGACFTVGHCRLDRLRLVQICRDPSRRYLGLARRRCRYVMESSNQLHTRSLPPASHTAGKECTAVFFGLHRQEILYNPRYAKLVIGQIENEQQLVRRNEAGSISQVPYAEPMWLSPGFKRSPYFKESHYALQKGKSYLETGSLVPVLTLLRRCRGPKVCRRACLPGRASV